MNKDGRLEVMRQLAEDVQRRGETFFYVRISGNIKPVERGELYEDALIALLEAQCLGSVTEGGSQLDPRGTIAFCGLMLWS